MDYLHTLTKQHFGKDLQSQLFDPFSQSSDKDLEHNSINTQNGYM
jgi:hypothetical protein